MRISSGFSTAFQARTAAIEAIDQAVDGSEGPPDWVVVYASVELDPDDVAKAVHEAFPDVPVHGATSCLGAMTEAGFHSDEGRGLAVLAVRDAAGSYGTGVAQIGDDPRQAAADALIHALGDADRMGEQPAVVWLSAVPGSEEQVLAGIHDVIGTTTPIAGGSAADNTIEGTWRQFHRGEALQDNVVVSVLFPSTPLHHSFHNGYSPTEHTGRVTAADGRTLREIDGRPAADVYAEWTGESVELPSEGGSILAESTMRPLGRRVEAADGEELFVLAHPATLHPDGSIDLFADIDVGDILIGMRGTSESLVTRAGRVATAALHRGALEPADVAGALVVYCAGCMLAVREDMPRVATEMREALGGNPFIGTFTFGEQGCFVGGDNHHGNLMISVVAFARPV